MKKQKKKEKKVKDKRKRNNKSSKLNRKKKTKKQKTYRWKDPGVLGVDRRSPVPPGPLQPTSEERREIKGRSKKETRRSRERKSESDV